MNEVTYKFSTYPSRFLGYQAKKQDTGTVTLYISSIWNEAEKFDDFLEIFLDTLILERICLERGFQKIRMKNRCKPFTVRSPYNGNEVEFPCKMSYIATLMVIDEK